MKNYRIVKETITDARGDVTYVFVVQKRFLFFWWKNARSWGFDRDRHISEERCFKFDSIYDAHEYMLRCFVDMKSYKRISCLYDNITDEFIYVRKNNRNYEYSYSPDYFTRKTQHSPI